MRVAIDTWAFREIAQGTPRGLDAAAVIAEADGAFTVRECVVETYSAILHRTRRPDRAMEWWDGLRETGIRVYEPPLDEVHAFIEKRGRSLAFTLADWSLACVAERERTRAIVTEDAEFRRLDLDPLFAAR